MSVIKSWIKKNHDKLSLFGSDIHHVEDFLSTISESDINNLEFAEFIENFKKWEESFQQKVNDEGTVLVECELDEHYNLVKLIDKKSKEWESNFMNHCVRQYNDAKHVYSIRHNITKKPVCTIELENNEIKQIKGKGNQRVSIKYVDYVIKSLNYFNCKILDDDMLNIGLIRYSDDEINLLRESIYPCRVKFINNNYYLACNNKFFIKDIDNLTHFFNLNNEEDSKEVRFFKKVAFLNQNDQSELVNELIEKCILDNDLRKEFIRYSILCGNECHVNFLIKNSEGKVDFSQDSEIQQLRIIFKCNSVTFNKLKFDNRIFNSLNYSEIILNYLFKNYNEDNENKINLILDLIENYNTGFSLIHVNENSLMFSENVFRKIKKLGFNMDGTKIFYNTNYKMIEENLVKLLFVIECDYRYEKYKIKYFNKFILNLYDQMKDNKKIKKEFKSIWRNVRNRRISIFIKSVLNNLIGI